MQHLEQELEQCRPMIEALFRRAGLTEAASQDAVQDVFVKVWPRRDRFLGKARLSTWLYRIAANHLIDLKRSRRDTREQTGVLGSHSENVGVDEDRRVLDSLLGEKPVDVEEQVLEEVWRQQILERLQKSLTPPDPTIITLFYCEETSDAEIAELLGMRAPAVKMRRNRALQRLRELWSHREGLP